MRADDASGLQQRATGGRKTDLGKFLDISRQSECAVTMPIQVEQPTNLYDFRVARLRWTWSREAEEAAGGEPAGPRDGESAPFE